MKSMQRLFIRMTLASVVALVAVGCVDESDETSGGGAALQNQPEQQDGDECEDGQTYNPIEDRCVELQQEEGPTEQDNEDCPEGQSYDPISNECTDICAEGCEYDPQTEECYDCPVINDAEECGPFEEWDDDAGECVETGECGPGNLIGQTCRPDGGLLPGAQVTIEGVDCDGVPFLETTAADQQGNYQFHDIPAGEHDLTITSGSWEDTSPVPVIKDETTDLSTEAEKICLQGTDVDIAVIPGTWDDIGEILDGMDIQYDLINDTGGLLGDLEELTQYDIVFAECGASWSSFSFDTDMEIIESNVRRFVEEGNSLYASDLSDDYIDDPLPDAVQFATSSGSGSQYVDADVVSEEMQNALGVTTTEIYFNMGGWSIAEDGGPASTVHFRADVSTGSSTVEDAALMIHYNDPIGDGRAIYTSFHNTAQTTGDMEEILEYMIFTL